MAFSSIVGIGALENQKRIDASNVRFWEELCGSSIARSLGITTVDNDALRRFDEAYLGFYPYLWNYLSREPKGRRVLEIGLGFGTVGHILASGGASYHAIDIANGPVAMMRYRLASLRRPARALRGSALALPYGDSTFDAVYAIGCLHHIGDLRQGIAEVHRVLRPGGRAVVMIYNRLSLRRLLKVPLKQFWLEAFSGAMTTAAERARYDANATGEAAPHTDFVSRREARRLFRGFKQVTVESQNCDDLPLLISGRRIPRAKLLGTLGRWLGLDLYVVATR